MIIFLNMKVYVKYTGKLPISAQKQFLLQKVVAQLIKTMNVGIPTHKSRTATYIYYFDKNDSKIRLCKDIFLKTLCISNDPINEALKYRDELGINELAIRVSYKTIFESEFNLSFLTCTRYDSAGRPENLKEEYDFHVLRKIEAQQAKESDKQRSLLMKIT